MICAVPESSDSWMFHRVNLEHIDLFAECLGTPLLKIRVSGIKEQEVQELTEGLRDLRLEVLVSGTVASRYQKERIDRLCEEMGAEHVTPLWGRDQLGLLKEEVGAGLQILITSVSAEGLDQRWLGRILDERAVEELGLLAKRFGLNPAGEGGEYETMVLDAPFFRKRLEVRRMEKTWNGTRGSVRLEVQLCGKDG